MNTWVSYVSQEWVKNPANAGDPGMELWVRKIPWRRKWQPTPVFLPGKSHGWRSLVSYSPWSHKELETTEQFHFLSFHHPSSVAQLCPTLCHPWTAACQVSLSITNSRSLLKLMSIESVMPSNHLILCPSSPAFNLSQHQGLFQ